MPNEFSNRTKINEFLEDCEGFEKVFDSTSSTIIKDEAKIASSNNCTVLMILYSSILIPPTKISLTLKILNQNPTTK